MTSQVRAALIIGGSLVVAALIALVAVLLTRGDDDPAAPTSSSGQEQPRTLPDGTTATAAQDAFLDAVEPHLSPAKAGDILGVLSSGESFCTIYLEPSDPAIQAQGAQSLRANSGYNETEATAIVTAAAEHLCPGK